MDLLKLLDTLPCLKCEYSEECSPEAPEYLYTCKTLEDWVIRQYKKYLRGKR